jgi:hypothetical protein
MSEQKPARADTFGTEPVEPSWPRMVREHPWIVDRLLVHGINEENFGYYATESAFPGHAIVHVSRDTHKTHPDIILMTDKTFGDRDFTYEERQAWRAGQVEALKRDAAEAYGLHGYFSVPLEKSEEVVAPLLTG